MGELKPLTTNAAPSTSLLLGPHQSQLGRHQAHLPQPSISSFPGFEDVRQQEPTLFLFLCRWDCLCHLLATKQDLPYFTFFNFSFFSKRLWFPVGVLRRVLSVFFLFCRFLPFSALPHPRDDVQHCNGSLSTEYCTSIAVSAP